VKEEIIQIKKQKKRFSSLNSYRHLFH